MKALLDSNVVIALLHTDHVHYEAAHTFVHTTSQFSLCPITEGAFFRTSLRIGTPLASAQEALHLLSSHPDYRWVPDSLSYGDVDWTGVTGHRQVTDRYLHALAIHHNLTLATFDKALATLPGVHLIPA